MLSQVSFNTTYEAVIMKKAQKKNDSTGLAIAGGVAAGAAAGSFLGPFGAAAGAIIGGMAGANADPIIEKVAKAKPMASIKSMKAKPAGKKAKPAKKKAMSSKMIKSKKTTASAKRKK